MSLIDFILGVVSGGSMGFIVGVEFNRRLSSPWREKHLQVLFNMQKYITRGELDAWLSHKILTDEVKMEEL